MHGTRTTNDDDYRMSPEQIDMRRLRQDSDIERIAGFATPLMRQAGELRGPCPLHEDRADSFVVDERTQTFHCEACDASGDVIDLVRLQAGCSQIMACEWLMGSHRTCPADERPTVRMAAEARARAVELARAIWKSAGPIAGTPAEAYVRSLGLDQKALGGVRYKYTPINLRDEAIGYFAGRPSLVAGYQDVDGAIVGVARVLLGADGVPLDIDTSGDRIGQVHGTTIRFGPQAATIVLCAEMEEALAVRRIVRWPSVWAAATPGSLAETLLPVGTRRVVLVARGDRSDIKEIARARAAFKAKRLRVDVIRPSGDRTSFLDAIAGESRP